MTGRRFGSDRLTIDAAVVFALFAVFTVAVLLVLLLGAGVYRSTAAGISDSYSERTAEAYLISKVRHADATGADGSPLVKVARFGDTDTLALYEEYGGVRDVTYIYWRDGWLCELYAGADDALDPSLGERIIAAEKFAAALDGSVLSMDIGAGTSYLFLRCQS